MHRKYQFLQEVQEQGVMRRKTHFMPELDLYLTNLDLTHSFTHPLSPPCLGRSQDLCWITKVEEVGLKPMKSGNLGSTMIDSRIIKKNIPGYIVRYPEW